MVIFNDLRITEDKDCLIVDCYIEDIDGYEGMYIDSVKIEYYKNFTDEGCVSDHALTLYEDDGAEKTSVRCLLNKSTIEAQAETFGTDTFDGGLFLVTVECDGTPSNASVLAQYTCGSDSTVDIGVVVDWQSVYRQGMGYAAKLAYGCDNPCEVPSGFEQFILYWYALQLAISTCDWLQVKKLWDKFLRAFHGGGQAVSVSSGCGCGR